MSYKKPKRVFDTELTEYDLRDSQFEALEAYVNSGGNITKAAIEAGIVRKTFYNWMREDNFKIAREAADREIKRRREIDDVEKVSEVEEKLYENALEGRSNEIFFYLKNRAPERWANDYVQGQRFLQQNNQNNFYFSDFQGLSNAELMSEVKKLTGRGDEIETEEKISDVEYKESNKEIQKES